MHARAVIRGCLIACTAGCFLALLFIVAAASALSPDPPDWARIVPTVLLAAALVAVPLTGMGLGVAWLAARRKAEVGIGWAVALGTGLGGLAGLVIGGTMIGLLFGALGAMAGLGAWLGAFGTRRRVQFG